MYGGTILLGHCPGECTVMDVQTIIEVCMLHHNCCANIIIDNRLIWVGLMDIGELHKIECHALPGSGLVVRTVSVAHC